MFLTEFVFVDLEECDCVDNFLTEFVFIILMEQNVIMLTILRTEFVYIISIEQKVTALTMFLTEFVLVDLEVLEVRQGTDGRGEPRELVLGELQATQVGGQGAQMRYLMMHSHNFFLLQKLNNSIFSIYANNFFFKIQ